MNEALQKLLSNDMPMEEATQFFDVPSSLQESVKTIISGSETKLKPKLGSLQNTLFFFFFGRDGGTTGESHYMPFSRKVFFILAQDT
jgi:hypothetical protein